MANLIGHETLSNIDDKGQVYQATHDGVGESLPYMSRSFISFTFDGKTIESFGLIVVNKEDRMERKAYADFNDLTSTYDTLNGQIYWGSNFSANQIDFTLATDGITERQIDDFKEWFAPGKERELILSEHPNRVILARVASAPVLSFLPFEKKVDMKIARLFYETSTTLYKGEVQLSLIMDEPYWYAKLNYMPSYVNKKTLKALEQGSRSPNKVETINNKDMIKIMYEDGIPHQSLLTKDMFLGGNILVFSEARTDLTRIGDNLGIMTKETTGLSLNDETKQYLFYSGTAPSYPTIEFSIKPDFDNNNYISNPRNKIQNPDLLEFSYIKIGDKKFEFTTPSILTGYNQAIKIFKEKSIDSSPSEVINLLRKEIKERYSRAWAIACVNSLPKSSGEESSGAITLDQQADLITSMNYFINKNEDIKFTIDSKTGEAKGSFSVKQLKNSSETVENAHFYEVEENVGDMIISDYLTIEGRNYLNSDGEISQFDCKEITSNEDLTNVLIFFKNMYL